MIRLGSIELTDAVLLLGAITGLTYGILAVGLVLTYRSTRIINFAHAEVGAFGAAVMGVAVSQWGVPYWIGTILALSVGAAVGVGAEVFIMRRLRHAPRVMGVVATLGLGQFLLFSSNAVNSQLNVGKAFPQPPNLPEFRVGPLLVTRAYSAMLIFTPLLIAGLAYFLRRTSVGIRVRAAAANRETAELDGVSPGRMSALTWGIAGAIAAYTVLLVLPTRPVVGAEVMGPSLLLRALAAAVIARMESLPVALGAGVGLGVVEGILLWNYPRGGFVEVVLFGIVLAVLLVQRRGGVREADDAGWLAVVGAGTERVARLPGWLGRLPGWSRWGLALAVGIGLGVVGTNASAVTLTLVVAFAIVGLSMGIVTGLAGELSLGQFGLAGVGAAVSYHLVKATGSFPLAFLAAAAVGALASLVIGVPALRIRGLMLAVATLGFALSAQSWLLQQPWTLGGGVNPQRPVFGGVALDTARPYYFFSLVVLAVALWMARNVWRSGLGRRMRAVRDNEDVARSFGVPARRVKVQAFTLAGALAGLGGALYGHGLSRIAFTSFPIRASIDVAAIAAIGGIGVLAGPLLGALYVIGLPEILPRDSGLLAATALGWLVLVVYFPGGIVQLLQRLGRVGRSGRGRMAGGAVPDPGAGDEPTFPALAGRLVRQGPAAGVTASSGPILEAAGIEKRYGGVQCLQGVDLVVMPGEIVGLIGPNGAGKTTLFEVLSGFAPADGGRVSLLGRDVTRSRAEVRADLGLVRSFQDGRLFPSLTALETVCLALEREDPSALVRSLLRGPATDRAKIGLSRDILALFGLSRFEVTPVAALSTGTRRVLDLACAYALRPTILLLDEPSSGIAQRETEALGELLALLRSELAMTLVVIEHDIPLIMGLADRIVAMEAGRVIADGPPAEVRADPIVLAAYVGTDAVAVERSNSRSDAGAVRSGGPG